MGEEVIDFDAIKKEIRSGVATKKLEVEKIASDPLAAQKGIVPKLEGREFLLHMHNTVNGSGSNPASNAMVNVMEATETIYTNMPPGFNILLRAVEIKTP